MSPSAGAAVEGREIVVGTRGSALALAQTAIVCDALRRAHPAIAIRVERITTTGDVRNDVPLSQLGRGIFVTEIESALRERRIDIAVHSAKDLPSTLAPEFSLGAILPRADARDVLVSSHGTLRKLPVGARVGTSSPRRGCQIRALRPDLEIVDVRGNVDTRLRKLAAGEFEALVLAAAGLIRLDRVDAITEWLDADAFIPSVGQGALAVEIRTADASTLELVRPLDDPLTRAAVTAERAFLAELGAGCRAAAGAFAREDRTSAGALRIAAFIGSPLGDQVRAIRSDRPSAAHALGVAIAHELIRNGASRFLAAQESALAGKIVAITRAEDQSTELAMLLRARGALPMSCPTIAIELIADLSQVDAVLFGPRTPRWIVFTSANAVDAVADHLSATAQRLPAGVRLAAIGHATALALAGRIRNPDFVPTAANAATMAAELPDVAGGIVLFPRGNLAPDTLAAGLSERGAAVRDVIVYRTTAGYGVDELTSGARIGQLDAVIFASPSSVRFAADAIGALRSPNDVPVVVCIGATTALAARELGLHPIESPSPSIGAIVETLERSLAARATDALVSSTRGG